MKLFTIGTRPFSDSVKLLKNACSMRGIGFDFLNVSDGLKRIFPLDTMKGDLLYRIGDFTYSQNSELEYFILGNNLVTFYANSDVLRPIKDQYSDMVIAKVGLATPKTLIFIPRNREDLNVGIQSIGGYPVIVKVLGGSHGVGVIKVDSQQALYGLVDMLFTRNIRFLIKEYIPVNYTIRLIVLGDEVIGGIEYVASSGDFRSNAGIVPTVRLAKIDPSCKDLSIKAVHTLGFEFGGVDILPSDRGPLVAEVNFPCYFPRVQKLAGIDIAGMMVDYLIEKSHRLFQ